MRLASIMGITPFAMCLVLMSTPALAAGAGTATGALGAEVDSLIADLYRVAKAQGDRTSGPSDVVRLDGIAWETPDGTWTGASEVGVDIEEQIRAVLASRATVVRPDEPLQSKGILGDVIRGAVRTVGGALSLTLELADVASGRKIADVTSTLDQQVTSRLGIVGIAPPDSSGAAGLAQILDNAMKGLHSDFHVRITTDRGQYAAYKEGEPISLYVETDRDCYVRVYHMAWSDKKITQVFPPDSSTDARLTAGTVRKIPDGQDQFLFEAAPPYGVDAMIAVGSTEPIVDATGSDAADSDADASSTALNSESVAQIASKGILIRAREETDADSGTDASDDETRDTVTTTSPAAATAALSARAVCYFTTLKR